MNMEITTKKREGEPRVGKLLTVSFKEIKILLKIILKNLIKRYKVQNY